MQGRLIAGFLAAAVIVALLVSLAYWSSARAVDTARDVSETHEIVAETQGVLSTLADAETSVRGFALTGDRVHLEPYLGAREVMPGRLAELRRLSSVGPDQSDRLARLDGLIGEKFVQLESMAELAAEPRVNRAAVATSAREGKAVMDEIRALVAEMTRDGRDLLVKRTAAAEDTRSRVHVAYAALAATLLLLLALLFLVIHRHMQERYRAENAVAQSERLLRAIVDGTTDSVFVKDLEGRYQMINAAGARVLGHSQEHILGRSARDVLSSASADYIHLVDMAVMDSGQSRSSEDTVVIAGEERTFLSTRGPLLDGNGRVTGLFGISREITGRKKAEAALITLNRDLAKRSAEAESANRELEAFSYSVSHDLRAPLRHIDGFVGLLQKRIGTTLDEQSLRQLDTIARSARHMGRLIDDLLVFSRMGRTEMRRTRVELSKLTETAIHDVSAALDGREVEWVVGELPAVEGDESMLRLALVNLLDNAVKYTRPRPKARIEIGTDAPRNGSDRVIHVRDNGVGFDMRYADKLFGVFQRLHRSEDFEGTGIGLANVRRIVERHGGRVWGESVLGEGATFYLSLPSADGARG
jgi:PAS domain S-box-containing protein